MNISEFFNNYFLKGWSNYNSYNVFDTSLYAILAVVLAYFTYEFLKNKIKFDVNFAISLIPFIVLASIVRVYADLGVYIRGFWTVTPGVWIIFLILIVLTSLLDYKFKTKNKLKIIIPLIIIVFHLPYFKIVNSMAIIYYLFFYLISIIPFILLSRKYKFFNNKLNMMVMFAQLFDATSTFVNIDFFNYIEEHVVGGILTRWVDSGIIMYPLKLIVLLPILYYLDKQKNEEKNLINYIKVLIIVLGFGPGLRNFITLILGV